MDTNQMTMYETEDGRIRIDVLFDKENVWLTQKLMAMLFECSVDNVSLHLKSRPARAHGLKHVWQGDLKSLQEQLAIPY